MYSSHSKPRVTPRLRISVCTSIQSGRGRGISPGPVGNSFRSIAVSSSSSGSGQLSPPPPPVQVFPHCFGPPAGYARSGGPTAPGPSFEGSLVFPHRQSLRGHPCLLSIRNEGTPYPEKPDVACLFYPKRPFRHSGHLFRQWPKSGRLHVGISGRLPDGMGGRYPSGMPGRNQLGIPIGAILQDFLEC